MVDKPEVEHIIRAASLPWRPPQQHLTECGRPVAGYPSISLEDFKRKLSVLGKQRCSMTTCITCWNTATRYQPWTVDPVDAIRREVYGMRGDDERFRKELWALAALVVAHRDEFDDYLAGLDKTTDLTRRRRDKRASGR